jgi:hypothetical protein
MSRTGLLRLWMLAPVFGCAAGCFGVSQNPSYFPYWLPTGDLVQTHAKPIAPGYYANFDPHAVELAVQPTGTTSPVGSQVVILATVRDADGTPQRQRRVEWMVTGGNLVEVDESGVFPGRGGIDGRRGFSFTGDCEQRISRGNSTKADDIMVRPGQSWCVVSAADEGDTHVQVVVPGIFNWDKRMKTAVIHWVNATWEFPPLANAKSASTHEFVTKIVRSTDRQPLANYRVRYKIVSGPPAVLLPNMTEEQLAITDLNGLAKVSIAQRGSAPGINRISVEIIRPPDPTTPSGAGVSIVTGETSVEWLAPEISLGQPIPLGQATPNLPAPNPQLGQPVPSVEPVPPQLPPGGGIGSPVIPGNPK